MRLQGVRPGFSRGKPLGEQLLQAGSDPVFAVLPGGTVTELAPLGDVESHVPAKQTLVSKRRSSSRRDVPRAGDVPGSPVLLVRLYY